MLTRRLWTGPAALVRRRARSNGIYNAGRRQFWQSRVVSQQRATEASPLWEAGEDNIAATSARDVPYTDLIDDPTYYAPGEDAQPKVDPPIAPEPTVRRIIDNSTRAPKKRIPIDVHDNGRPVMFDSIFLRDCCTCPLCVDTSHKQKLFQTSDIPSNIKGFVRSYLGGNKYVHIEWDGDIPTYPPEHRTIIPLTFLRNAITRETRLQQLGVERQLSRNLWDRSTMSRDNEFIDFESYMTNDRTLYTALHKLHTHGLVFLKDVPPADSAILSLTSRIGPSRNTFYGRTWDVKSVPDAKNVAYTHQHLGLHMDLLYTTNPPHLQLLHCLRNRSPGGASLFSDAFRAAEVVRAARPDLFAALADFPVTFHYRNDSQHYRFTRPTVEFAGGAWKAPRRVGTRQWDIPLVPPEPRVSRVNWSPPFQAPFAADIGSALDGKELRRWHKAAAMFSQLVNAEEALFEHRLEEGECVVFDNRRVLHARRAFDASRGERWLKGAYVDDDVYKSRLAVLREKFGGIEEEPERKVGVLVRKHFLADGGSAIRKMPSE